MNVGQSIFATPALVGFMMGGLALRTMPQHLEILAYPVIQIDFGVSRLLELPKIQSLETLGVGIEIWRTSVPTNTAPKNLSDSSVVEKQNSNSVGVVELLEDIRQRTGLTWELVAPLLGVTPRSLHLWKSDREISAANENRVRAVSEVLEKLPTTQGRATKDLLLTRTPGYVRIYDLLAEGKYEQALSRANQTRELEPMRVDKSLRIEHLPIDVQLITSDEVGNPAAGKLDRRYSRQLKV